MAEDAVPGSQLPVKPARRKRYFSRISRYSIIGAAFGVPLGWLFAIGTPPRRPDLLSHVYWRYILPNYMTALGGFAGLLGMFGGFVVGLGSYVRRKLRRAQPAGRSDGPPPLPGPKAATWDTCRADFAFDGALIDLLAPGTGPAEWEAFWSALRAGPFRLRAFRDGEPIPLPESARWMFAEREVASVMVSVLAGNVTANCHFFGGDLELDIDPREVAGDSAFESVLAVMRFVAAAVRRPVFAVAEGGAAANAFLRVSPEGQAEFLPAGSVRRT